MDCDSAKLRRRNLNRRKTMAFLDDLGKTLTQAGQSVAQKTKEIAEVAKLNSQISEEEKRINDYYLQIGKLYVSLHKAGQESGFEELISGISEAEEKIEDYRQQIQEVRGIVKCEECGTEIPKDAAFCSVCGAPAPKREKETEAADVTLKEDAPTFDKRA